MESYESADTVPKRVKYWADLQPDKEAIVIVSQVKPRASLTSKQLYDRSKRFASHLTKMGIQKGNVVCNCVPDSVEGIVAFFGIMFAGGIVQNNLIQFSDGKDLLQNLQKSKCQAVILSSNPDNLATKIFTKHFQNVRGHDVKSNSLPHLKYVVYTGSKDEGYVWHDDTEGGDDDAVDDCGDSTITNEDGAIIVLTSGSTGFSKLVLYAHRNILNMGRSFSVIDTSNPAITILDSHVINWAWGLPFWYLRTGRRRVCLDRSSIPKGESYVKFLRDVIIQENCQVAKLSANIALQMEQINQKDSISFPHWPLEIVYTSGQPLKMPIVKKTLGTLGRTICNTYGGSEFGIASVNVISTLPDYEDFNAGRLLDGVHIKIVNNSMEEVPVGSYGHILMKTDTFFKRYIGNEDVLRPLFTEDGWLKTNDYGRFNDKGEIIVQGRYDDVIMRGENYYHPSWIENIIRRCPGISDVVVVKVPDEELLSEICACFIPNPGAPTGPEDVREFCEKEFISNNPEDKTGCPKYYLKFDSFLLNANEKINRKAMERAAATKLNLI